MSGTKLQLIRLGHVRSAHGLKGQIDVYLESRDPNSFPQKCDEVFLGPSEQESKLFKVTKFSKKSDGLLMTLAGVNDRNFSETLKGMKLWVNADQLVSLPGENIYLMEILGFQVISQGRNFGEVVGFSSNGPQDLLVLQEPNLKKEILVPFVKDFIQKIDYQKRQIHMDLPEGIDL